MRSAPIGVIADDLTGATDLALMASERGLRAVVYAGVPASGTNAAEADVLVVALRSRTAPVVQAVAESRAALAWLGGHAERFYFKYCSTFDSTAQGNIGPVIEALLEDLGAPATIVTPAFPGTGRTVYRSHLFVGAQLLAETSMRHHPLTPMRDSHLVRLLQPQLREGSVVGAVHLEEIRLGARAAIDREISRGARAVVLDAVEDQDLFAIHSATADMPLTTGATGLASGWGPGGPVAAARVRAVGPSVALVGSQSAASTDQIARASITQPTLSVSAPPDDAALLQQADEVAHWCLARWAEQPARPVIVHSGRREGNVDPAAAERLERLFGSIASTLAASGIRRFIVGGGETSGAVLAALGITELRIGPAIAPGVCWALGDLDSSSADAAPLAQGRAGPSCALALKSGNFGGPDFLTRAWELLP